MNISENKRIFLHAFVYGAAFATIAYMGYSYYADADKKNERLSELSSKFDNYNASEFPPTEDSLNKLRKAYGVASKLSKELAAKMDRYAAAAKSAITGIKTPVDFQNAVNKAITEAKQAADGKKVQIGPGAIDLGFGSFKNTAALAPEVPYRAFMLAAVQNAVDTLIDAPCVTIDKIYCANLPEETQKRGRNAPDYFPLRFEISFTAKRGSLPAVLNAILKDNKFYYLITGLGAESNITLPSIEPYVEPRVTEQVVVDPEASADQGPAVAPNSVARPMTGLPTETVHVHLNLEVLYFNNK